MSREELVSRIGCSNVSREELVSRTGCSNVSREELVSRRGCSKGREEIGSRIGCSNVSREELHSFRVSNFSGNFFYSVGKSKKEERTASAGSTRVKLVR